MNEFWSSILQSVLVAVLPVLATALTAWLIQKAREVGKNINADTMTWIRWAASTAVTAAEQAGAAKLITDKKEYALTLAEEYLAKQGIKVDLSLLSGIIEAAVMTEINKDKPVLPPEA